MAEPAAAAQEVAAQEAAPTAQVAAQAAAGDEGEPSAQRVSQMKGA